MITKKFLCEVISPLVMNGGEKNETEIRAPSIKGWLRFWWRAVQGHDNKEILRNREAEIFGATWEKSSFSIKVRQYGELRTEKISLTPHHDKNYCSRQNPSCIFGKNPRCLKSLKSVKAIFEMQFLVEFMFYNPEWKDRISDLFEVACFLGGLGRRARRGFGSIKIVSCDDVPYEIEPTLEMICDKLNAIKPGRYRINGPAIEYVGKVGGDYPWIEKIEKGRSYIDNIFLLKRIGAQTHDHGSGKTSDKTNLKIGGIPRRYASPLYVTMVRDKDGFVPIITTLHSNEKSLEALEKERVSFKEGILYGN